MDTRRSQTLKAVVPLIGALLYGASPIDLLPDVLPLIGLLDDVVIVPTLLLMAYSAYRRNQKTQRVIVHPPMGR